MTDAKAAAASQAAPRWTQADLYKILSRMLPSLGAAMELSGPLAEALNAAERALPGSGQAAASPARHHRVTELSTGYWKCTCGAKLKNENEAMRHTIAPSSVEALADKFLSDEQWRQRFLMTEARQALIEVIVAAAPPVEAETPHEPRTKLSKHIRELENQIAAAQLRVPASTTLTADEVRSAIAGSVRTQGDGKVVADEEVMTRLLNERLASDAASDRASVREAALREAAAICREKAEASAWADDYSDEARSQTNSARNLELAIFALIAQPPAPAERDVPALSLERVRAVLMAHEWDGYENSDYGECECGPCLNREQWVEHILALLAAPETDKP